MLSSRFLEGFHCENVPNLLDAEADLEQGLDRGRHEYLYYLNECRFLELGLEKERYRLFPEVNVDEI